ncbi:MAG: hypothetical protein K8R85_05355 [Bacteroidetes bacterium]|nr:hypothetical protein [Bacteroidota bacterium]
MLKPKKITVRFFLNKKILSCSEWTENGKEIFHYPLYVNVTYNRKNMQFKSSYGFFYTSMKDVEESDKGLMAFEEKLIKKVILYETNISSDSDKYDLKGIKDKYKIYTISIYTALEHYLKRKLRLTILKTKNELTQTLNLNREDSKNTVLLLYKVGGILFDNFSKVIDTSLYEEIETYKKISEFLPRATQYDFPTIIDWLDGSYKKKLNEHFLKIYKRKPELMNSMTNLIENAVNDKISPIEKINQRYSQIKKQKQIKH